MMKTRLMVIAAALVGMFLYACQTATQPEAKQNANAAPTDTAASKSDPKVVEDIKEMLAKHDKALNDQNLDAVMATFSTDP